MEVPRSLPFRPISNISLVIFMFCFRLRIGRRRASGRRRRSCRVSLRRTLRRRDGQRQSGQFEIFILGVVCLSHFRAIHQFKTKLRAWFS